MLRRIKIFENKKNRKDVKKRTIDPSNNAWIENANTGLNNRILAVIKGLKC